MTIFPAFHADNEALGKAIAGLLIAAATTLAACAPTPGDCVNARANLAAATKAAETATGPAASFNRGKLAASEARVAACGGAQ